MFSSPVQAPANAVGNRQSAHLWFLAPRMANGGNWQMLLVATEAITTVCLHANFPTSADEVYARHAHQEDTVDSPWWRSLCHPLGTHPGR